MKFKTISISVIVFWITIFILLPLLGIVVVSMLSHTGNNIVNLPLTLTNYQDLLSFLFLKVLAVSLLIALCVTGLCLLFAFPFAYWVARTNSRLKMILLVLMIIPFWTSSLVRTYSMITLLSAKGTINMLLMSVGIIHQPLQLLFTNSAVIIGLVYNLLPFMILPIYANLDSLDQRLIDAAKDLGANTWQLFKAVIFPHSLPGVIAGCVLVFLPAMTLFYIPNLLGGARSVLLGNLISDQFLLSVNWPRGAAMSTVLTVLLLLMLYFYWRSQQSAEVSQ